MNGSARAEPSAPHEPSAASKRGAIVLGAIATLALAAAVAAPLWPVRLALIAGAATVVTWAAVRRARRAGHLALQHEEHHRALEKRLTRDLAAQQSGYDELFESRLLGRLHLDPSGSVVRANAAAGLILGVRPADLAGRPLEETLPGLWLAAHETQRAGEPGPPRRFCAVHANPKAARVEVATTVRFHPDGAALVELCDVSAEAHAVAALDALRASAAADQQVRTELLGQLRDAVRAPTTSALALAALTADARLSPAADALARSVQGSSKVLLDAVDELVDVSRLKAGAHALNPVELDLLLLVESAVATHAAAGRPAGWVLPAPRALTRSLIGDAPRLRQLVANLLQFAQDHAPRAAPLIIDLTTAPEADGRVTVTLSVSAAAATAIDPAELGADPPGAAPPAASGLGLAVARGLAERMGGAVTTPAGPAQGVPITARFVLARAVLRAATDVQVDLRDAEVVVALAHPAEARAVADCLTDHGARVARVHDLAGLTAAAPGRDALVADAALLIELRANDRHLGAHDAGGPVVFAVAVPGAPVEAAAAALLPGATWLDRPLRLSQLPSALRGALDGRAAADSAAASAPPWPAATATATPTGRRVLLIEDDAVNQLVATRMLEDLGLEVALAETGLAGLELGASGGFDLILLDCQLPDLDGFEVSRRLRASARPGASTPVLALTGRVMPLDIAQCRAAGMNDHLAKPLTRERLAAAVAPWLPPGACVDPVPVAAPRGDRRRTPPPDREA